MKKSSFERVIGKVSDIEKEKILKSREEIFNDQAFEELEGKECEKTPEELQIIDLANKMTNEIRNKYGLENFDVPAKNIHIIKKEEWPRKGKDGFYKSNFQGVAMPEEVVKLAFANTVFHEMVHFKSYNALQVTKAENPEIDDYRVGLTIKTRDGKKMFFSSLNEAITEEIVKRHFLENAKALSENPLFAQEIKQSREVIREHPNAKTNLGEPLFDSDTYYAEIKKISDDKKVTTILTKAFTYAKERWALNTLINKLFERNRKNFKNTDEVFEVFEKGMMTGNILPIGRLVDGTFGKGTFRKIGESEDLEVFSSIVKSL
jgi:hypothetical protein